jgi:putative ABC transport system permease protein
MNVLSLALRNLLRNSRRSIATLSAMGIGLTAVLVFGGYATNIVLSLQTAAVKRSGHLQVQVKGRYLDGSDSPVGYGIADYQPLLQRIKADPELSAVTTVATATLDFGAVAGNYNANASRSVLVSGVVASDRNLMSTWNAFGIRTYTGPTPLEGSPPDSAVIGRGVARKLRLCEALRVPDCQQGTQPGSAAPAVKVLDTPDDVVSLSELEGDAAVRPAGATRVELLAGSARGAPNVASLAVLDAVNVGVKEWDDLYFLMHLEQAQRLVYGSEPTQVTALVVQLRDSAFLGAARQRLQQLLDDTGRADTLEVLDFETLNPMYGQSVRFMMSIFTFIAVLIGGIVVFTVGNAMSTSVSERTVEIGTLRAIGLRRSGIRRMFVAEGLLLGAVGAVLGTVVSLAAAVLINHSGLSWTPPGHVASYLVQIDVLSNLPLLAGSALCLAGVAALSAMWPAVRASRLNIVDALRHV